MRQLCLPVARYKDEWVYGRCAGQWHVQETASAGIKQGGGRARLRLVGTLLLGSRLGPGWKSVRGLSLS
jgi:hypothetical protein